MERENLEEEKSAARDSPDRKKRHISVVIKRLLDPGVYLSQGELVRDARWRLCFTIFLIVVVLVTLPVWGREARHGPDGRVRVFYLGDCWGPITPRWEMVKDPKMVVTPVPASGTHLGGLPAGMMSKYLRLYMPRTFDRFSGGYDVVILGNTQSPFFTDKQLFWFRRGVEEGGQGLLMVGGRDTQLAGWDTTVVEDALPSTFLGTQTYEGKPFRAVPTDWDHEFVIALPFEGMPPYMGMCVVAPREGSTVILTSNTQGGFPVLIFHEYGEGSSMFHTPDWTPAWGAALWGSWEYYGDFVLNMLYTCAGLPVPQDPALMHSLRMYFGDYEVKRGMILSLADFIDKFGANTAVLDREMGSVSESRAHVSGLYMDQEYESALSLIQELIEELDHVQKLALKLKDRAMLWIYITEVSAVTGMSLICGTALWFLMVKRKLYREVGITRPGHKESREAG